MATVQELIGLGEQMGLQGQELRDFVREQQAWLVLHEKLNERKVQNNERKVRNNERLKPNVRNLRQVPNVRNVKRKKGSLSWRK